MPQTPIMLSRYLPEDFPCVAMEHVGEYYGWIPQTGSLIGFAQSPTELHDALLAYGLDPANIVFDCVCDHDNLLSDPILE